MAGKRKKQKFIAWMTCDKFDHRFQEEITFKKPTTKNVFPNLVSRRVLVTEL